MENYPLIPRSLEELEHIRHLIERRRIENAEKKLRRQILSENSPGHEVGSDIPLVIPSNFPPFFSSIQIFITSVMNHLHWKTTKNNVNKLNNPRLYSVLLGTNQTLKLID